MATRENVHVRCRQMIDGLNEREQWGLSQQQRSAYVEQILQHVPAPVLEAQLEQIVRHFHNDHRRVAALNAAEGDEQSAAWDWVKGEIVRVAQFKGLAWSKDRAVEIDDLVQTVQAEVMRGINGFHYGSSLRTWLQSVTVQRLRRYHRDASAAKRAAYLVPLEEAAERLIEWGDLEQEIMASVLVKEIVQILNKTGNKRYAQIFHLHSIGDQSSEEIGRCVQLHPSRVRALLKLVRNLLRDDVGLRNWNAIDDNDDAQRVS